MKSKGLMRDANGKTGLVFIKENVNDGGFLLDKTDNSVMRTKE